MAGYYDVVLWLIPLAMTSITVAMSVAGFGLTTAIPVASVVTVGLMGHAMFVRAPVDTSAADVGTQQAGSEPAQTAD